MEKIKISLNPILYKRAMNFYWYFVWKKAFKDKVLRKIKLTILSIFSSIFFLNIIILIIVLYLIFSSVIAVTIIFKAKKEYDIEIQNAVMGNYIFAKNGIVILYNNVGFYQVFEETAKHFFKWDNFSKALLSKNILFLVENEEKLSYHFSREEMGQENFDKIIKFISNRLKIEQIEIKYPIWYKILLRF